MRAGRLRLTLYLGGFVITFVAAGLFVGFLALQPPPPDVLRVAAKHVIGDLAHRRRSPAELEAAVSELARSGLDVTLYNAERRPIISSVTPPLAQADDRWTFRYESEGAAGRIEGVLRVRGPTPARALIPIAILLVALVLLVLVLARYLGRPLQKIETAARRFSAGDLTARARLRRADELGEVGRTFDEMANRVTELVTAQRELMANISHELHTPLARIQVALDLMLDGVDDHATDLLPRISHELAELRRLIDDVLSLSRFDLSRVQEGVHAPLSRELTDLAPLLEEAVRRLRERHAAHRVEVRLAGALPRVSIDRVLIRRVVENLLENACKYSEPATPIILTAESIPDGLVVRVTDQGIGIEAADLAQVFTPFFRTDRSRSRATGGFGLGLAFARRVVEAHGGSLSIASELDTGTTVTFTIPVVPPG